MTGGKRGCGALLLSRMAILTAGSLVDADRSAIVAAPNLEAREGRVALIAQGSRGRGSLEELPSVQRMAHGSQCPVTEVQRTSETRR